MFEDVKERLERAGLKRLRRHNRWRCNHRRLSPAKNKEGKRDPEMRQAKKGNQWRFGRSEHVGVDIR